MDQAWRPFPRTGFTVVSGWVGDPASAVGEISSMLFAWDAAGASEVDSIIIIDDDDDDDDDSVASPSLSFKFSISAGHERVAAVPTASSPMAAGASEVDLDAVAPPVKLKKLPRIVLFAL